MKKLYLILLAGLLVGISCRHGVDTSPVEVHKVLAISFIISTVDTALTAEIYQGQSLGKLIGDSLAVVSDAQVRISSEGKEVVLTYDPAKRRYQAVNPFRDAKDGTVFYLEVISHSGNRVTARSTLPPKPQMPVINGEMIGETRNPSLKSFKFIASWQNPSGYPYCSVWGNSTGVEGTIGQVFPLVVTIDPIQGIDRYPTERQTAGTNVTTGAVWGASEALTPFELSVIVANVEASIFKYYRSYWSYNNWEINTGNHFPNFREPASIFNNIEGGVGLFASINCSVATTEIDPDQ